MHHVPSNVYTRMLLMENRLLFLGPERDYLVPSLGPISPLVALFSPQITFNAV